MSNVSNGMRQKMIEVDRVRERLLGSGEDRQGQMKIAVILSGSAEDRRGRRLAAGVVVELSILPVALRRAAEDVVEVPGSPSRCRPLRRCPSSRRRRR